MEKAVKAWEINCYVPERPGNWNPDLLYQIQNLIYNDLTEDIRDSERVTQYSLPRLPASRLQQNKKPFQNLLLNIDL